MSIIVTVAALTLFAAEIVAQDSDVYQGKFIGKLNSYHHQVAGEVYAVNEFTFLIKQFIYDGNGPDTYFWAGSTNRPGPQGIIVPNEKGKTNVLKSYLNKDFTLNTPERKKITDFKWLAIYDLVLQENFGDITIPEGFEPPAAQTLNELSRRGHGVSSKPLVVLDSKTIKIPEFKYDGLGSDTYFWVGVGSQPSTKGFKCPDEKGYVTPLRAYDEEDVIIQLPGDLTVFNIDWFSIFNVETGENYGSVIIPDDLNVPPSLTKVIPHTSSLPNCEPLHRDVQVSWEVFGPQITIEIAARIEEDEYVGFGLSGSETETRMEGSDIAILYMDGLQGYAVDYNITAKSTCVSVLGAYKGVCRDDVLGGTDSNQFFLGSRKDGLTVLTYRRSLTAPDEGDKPFVTDGKSSIVWSVGKLDSLKRPTFHRLWPRSNTFLEFGRKPEKNCLAFVEPKEPEVQSWGNIRILEPLLRVFSFKLGPSGGRKGYEGITGQPGSDLAWYVNGYLVPELYLRRDFHYIFQVEGGNDPHSPTLYHPVIITDEPLGGYEQMTEEQRKKVRVLAGVEFTRRGQPRPMAAGRLCLWRHTGQRDRRLDEDFPTFQKFRNSLQLFCEEGGQYATLDVQPDNSWPDVVYYHSYTHPGMGWKINIVDSFNTVAALTSSQAASPSSPGLVATFIVFAVYLFRTVLY